MKDAQTMIDAFKGLPSQPKIYLCYPSKAYLTGDGINDDIISKEIIPMIKKLAKKNDLSVIDSILLWTECPNSFRTVFIRTKRERR